MKNQKEKIQYILVQFKVYPKRLFPKRRKIWLSRPAWGKMRIVAVRLSEVQTYLQVFEHKKFLYENDE
jgi:hypothetical protein